MKKYLVLQPIHAPKDAGVHRTDSKPICDATGAEYPAASLIPRGAVIILDPEKHKASIERFLKLRCIREKVEGEVEAPEISGSMKFEELEAFTAKELQAIISKAGIEGNFVAKKKSELVEAIALHFKIS